MELVFEELKREEKRTLKLTIKDKIVKIEPPKYQK